EGIHTYDIYAEGVSKQKVGTKEFADAVVKNLGKTPEKLKTVSYASAPSQQAGEEAASNRAVPVKTTVGVDVFVDWTAGSADELAGSLQGLTGDTFELIM